MYNYTETEIILQTTSRCDNHVFRLNGMCVVYNGYNFTHYFPLLEYSLQERVYCVDLEGGYVSCQSAQPNIVRINERLWDKGMSGFDSHMFRVSPRLRFVKLYYNFLNCFHFLKKLEGRNVIIENRCTDSI